MKQIITYRHEGSDIIQFFKDTDADFCYEGQWCEEAVEEALASGKVERRVDMSGLWAALFGLARLYPTEVTNGNRI